MVRDKYRAIQKHKQRVQTLPTTLTFLIFEPGHSAINDNTSKCFTNLYDQVKTNYNVFKFNCNLLLNLLKYKMLDTNILCVINIRLQLIANI